jgi:hypothetical protein
MSPANSRSRLWTGELFGFALLRRPKKLRDRVVGTLVTTVHVLGSFVFYNPITRHPQELGPTLTLFLSSFHFLQNMTFSLLLVPVRARAQPQVALVPLSPLDF